MRRNTDAENAFGDIMPEATVHICPVRTGDVALRITNREDIASTQAAISRTVMVCGAPTSDEVTAAYVAVPVSGAVYVGVTAVMYCSAGEKIGEAGAYRLEGLATSVSGTGHAVTIVPVKNVGGTYSLGLLTPVGSGNAEFSMALCAGAATRVVGITIVSSAHSPVVCTMEITSMPTVVVTS